MEVWASLPKQALCHLSHDSSPGLQNSETQTTETFLSLFLVMICFSSWLMEMWLLEKWENRMKKMTMILGHSEIKMRTLFSVRCCLWMQNCSVGDIWKTFESVSEVDRWLWPNLDPEWMAVICGGQQSRASRSLILLQKGILSHGCPFHTVL
jgi:hypothetical protein